MLTDIAGSVGGGIVSAEGLQWMGLSTVALNPPVPGLFDMTNQHSHTMYTQFHFGPAPEARGPSPGQPHPRRIRKLSFIGRMSCKEMRM